MVNTGTVSKDNRFIIRAKYVAKPTILLSNSFSIQKNDTLSSINITNTPLSQAPTTTDFYIILLAAIVLCLFCFTCLIVICSSMITEPKVAQLDYEKDASSSAQSDLSHRQNTNEPKSDKNESPARSQYDYYVSADQIME